MSDAGTLLIVEDDKDLRELLVNLFKPHGLTILEAVSANAAFDILKQGAKVDVIISDIKMRDGGGFELLAKIKATGLVTHKPRVILVTGFPTIDLAKAQAYGASDLLTKPFNNKTLKASVSKCLIAAGRPGLPNQQP